MYMSNAKIDQVQLIASIAMMYNAELENAVMS